MNDPVAGAALILPLLIAIVLVRQLLKANRAARSALAALQESEARSRQALRARDELLAIVSHDLKNPVQAIFMTAARVEEAARARDDEAALRMAQRLKRSADRMSRLIFDLLDVASIDAGGMRVDPVPCGAAALLAEAAESMRPIAVAKRIRLDVVVEAYDRVSADKERIAQVFSNLLGNAVKFTPEEGVVRMAAERGDGCVCFSVVDTGPGIASEEREHIFDRFWRARSEGRGGAGLGLNIAKGIVDAHGGRIWVESAPGEGAAIRFTLPTAQAQPDQQITPPDRSSRAGARAPTAARVPTSSTSP